VVAVLVLIVTGVVLANAGARALLWQRTELAQAAAAGQRVDLVLRMDQPAKVRDSPWGGDQSVAAVGVAWPDGNQTGAGVPTVAYFDAGAVESGVDELPGGGIPAAGAVLRLRARLSSGERAAPERVAARVVGAVQAARPTGWRGAIYDLRTGFAGRASPLLEGIGVGNTSRIDTGLDGDLKATSLTHITAVSGAHVAIVLGAVLGLAAMARFPRWAMAGVGAATLAGFVALIGPGPSVWRAVLMGLVGLAGIASGKTRLALGALAAAVLGVLLADPWLARSYGLVLSALATAALIVLAPPAALALRRRWPRLPAALAEAVALTGSAQLLCAPVIVIFSGQLSLTALPANILAGPAVPVATIAAMVSVLAGPWSSVLADAAVAVGNAAAGYIGWVATWVGSWPLAAIKWPAGSGGFALAVTATAGVALSVWWLRRRGRLVRGLAIGLVVIVSLAAGPGREPLRRALGQGPPDDWVAAVCDVGQGTAVVVRSGPDAAVLIDAGPESGGVDGCLERLGVGRLDLVLLTHFHADHVGGLEEALKGRQIGELVYGPSCGQDSGRPLSAAKRAGATLRPVDGVEPVAGRAGMAKVTIYPSPLTRLCPEGPGKGEDRAVNDAGLAVMLETSGMAIWALGDLEEPGQDALVASLLQAGAAGGPGTASAAEVPGTPGMPSGAGTPVPAGAPDQLRGGVVVVAHHGSASQSAALAESLAPQMAVMSAGRDNSYGHPSRAALDLYARFGQVRRTDQEGTVIVRPQ
jgi:competence protein ComEC